MHRAVAEQTGTPKLFITQPWAIAFKHNGNEGYVVSAASNIAGQGEGRPARPARCHRAVSTADRHACSRYRRGKNPRGIVINSTDTRAYVMNYVSRDVTVIDLPARAEPVATLPSAALPAPAHWRTRSTSARSSTTRRSACSTRAFGPRRRSRDACPNSGWGSCSTCHPVRPHRQRRVDFRRPARGAPSRSTPTSIRPIRRGAGCGILNWSAERDEQEDFELEHPRGVSGGPG